MLKNILLIASCFLLFFASCKEDWDDHYETYEPQVNEKLFNHLKGNPQYSSFMNYLKVYQLDSILLGNGSKTLFIPTNEAFENLDTEDTLNFMTTILSYHISPTVLLSSINGSKKLLSNAGKYIEIDQSGGKILVDGITSSYSSPLFLDGKYYELPVVALPAPSIYQYLELYNPFLQRYINSLDTLELDKSLSIPIGYNDKGETVYDSVYNRYNLFELEYFPIRKEFRSMSATLILFTQVQLDNALEIMASKLGIKPEEIPAQWINEIFLPQIFEKGVFDGIVDYKDFRREMLNIKRDTSYVNPAEIDPASKFYCSNGVVYNFLDFMVPEKLYLSQRKFEAEKFVKPLGLNRYIWDIEKVKVQSDMATEPVVSVSSLASNDTIISVALRTNYVGKYAIEFTLDNVFPGNYVLEWRGNYRPSGNYKVYVNGTDVTHTSPMVNTGSFDTFNFRQVILSVISGKFFIRDANSNNSIDFLVQNIIKEYGKVIIRIEYQNKGSQSTNGLSIDYLALTPLTY